MQVSLCKRKLRQIRPLLKDPPEKDACIKACFIYNFQVTLPIVKLYRAAFSPEHRLRYKALFNNRHVISRQHILFDSKVLFLCKKSALKLMKPPDNRL